jgi:hypothetical protein
LTNKKFFASYRGDPKTGKVVEGGYEVKPYVVHLENILNGIKKSRAKFE